MEEMDRVVPWAELEALVRPHYRKGENGRPPMGLAIMLPINFLQEWFNLSDPAAEEALYDSPVLRRFAGGGPGPCSCARRDHHLQVPPSSGGTRAGRSDAGHGEPVSGKSGQRCSIFTCTSTVRSNDGPDIGVDAKEGHVHSVCTSAASVSDVHMLPDLLHGEEKKVWGDGGYQGQSETTRQAAPYMTSRRTRYKHYIDELQRAKNRVKARVRAKVEHPFRIVKRIFGFNKTRYGGLGKNHQRLCVNFALANLYLHRRRPPLGA